MFNPEEPYNELLPISELGYEPSMQVQRAAEETRVTIAVLDYALKKLASPEVLLETLALQEAKNSSGIENIRTSNEDLYRNVAFDALDAESKEISDYTEALIYGSHIVKDSGSFSLSEIEKINGPVNKKGNGIRSNLPGFKSTTTRIVGGSGDDYKVIYTPPHDASLLRSLLLDMLEYVLDDDMYDINPLVKIALAHYQFECIHPFADGNGRTGRILNLLFLCQKQYLSSPVLFASSYILSHKEEYYNLLDETKKSEDYEPFILYMLKSFEVTANRTLRVVEGITELLDKYTDRDYLSKFIGQYDLWRLTIDTVFRKVYVRNSDIVDAGLHRQTSAVYLDQLVEEGLLVKEKHGRENIYKNIKLLELFNSEE